MKTFTRKQFISALVGVAAVALVGRAPKPTLSCVRREFEDRTECSIYRDGLLVARVLKKPVQRPVIYGDRAAAEGFMLEWLQVREWPLELHPALSPERIARLRASGVTNFLS